MVPFLSMDNSSVLQPTSSIRTENSNVMSLSNDIYNDDNQHNNVDINNSQHDHNVSFGSDSGSVQLPYFPYLSLSDNNNIPRYHPQQQSPTVSQSIFTINQNTSSSSFIPRNSNEYKTIDQHYTPENMINTHRFLNNPSYILDANDNINDNGYDSEETTVSENNNNDRKIHTATTVVRMQNNNNVYDDQGMEIVDHSQSYTDNHDATDNDNNNNQDNNIIRIIPGSLLRIPSLNQWNPTYSLHLIVRELRTILYYYAHENFQDKNDNNGYKNSDNDNNNDDDI